MDFYRPNFQHDSTVVCVNKLFNMIQSCRTDAAIMRGRKESYEVDSDMIKVAEALVTELRLMV